MWKDPKTGKEVPMPFRSDADSWESNISHCLACLLISSSAKFLSQCQSPNMINWIFPHYLTRKQPCRILNNILKECEPHDESLYNGVTGSALRGGRGGRRNGIQ